MMQNYNVTGMSCAACSAAVEKAVKGVEGVDSCAVSLLTNSMSVEGSADENEVISAVKKAGYGASLKGKETQSNESVLTDNETPKIAKRLVASVILLLALMYFSMGHMMLGFPVPLVFKDNIIGILIIELILSAAVMVINGKFFISGTKSLRHRSPNMDTLVSLGSATSFIWSVYALVMISFNITQFDYIKAAVYSKQIYFESAAMILTLITVGKLLEAKSKGKTTNALKSLMKLKPATALILKDGKETQIPASDIKKGDIFVLKAGQKVPADGIIEQGSGSIDESALTGESIPAEKETDSRVWAATIVKSGYMKCRAEKVGDDTSLSEIIRTVENAAATKAPIAKIADKVAGVFVPAVIIIAIITAVIWLIAGKGTAFALSRAVAVLVISCPCSLGLATPVAITVGNGIGAKNGILFKSAESLEQAGKTQIVLMDKTGTITNGTPVVTEIMCAPDTKESDLLRLAYSLEKKSEHPLAKAICEKAEELNLEAFEAENYSTFAGGGISAKIGRQTVSGGNKKFIEKYASVAENLLISADTLADEGKTPIYFAVNGKCAGIIACADTPKDSSRGAITELKNMGIYTVMLTGDNEKTANAIAKTVGVDKVIASVLPNDKARIVKEYSAIGKTAMVGDGINDAPALTQADIGIAVGAGTDVAIDAADIVLIKNDLSDVSAAIRLGRATLRNIKQNLFWAFFYNAVCIPVAAGALIAPFNITISPMIAAAAMSLSSFCVVTNALRLNFINIHSTKRDKKIKRVQISEPEQEEKQMKEKVIKVNGMMCPHCEARVKAALESVEGIDSAAPSHEKGEVKIALSAAVSDEIIEKTVSEAGYEVVK